MSSSRSAPLVCAAPKEVIYRRFACARARVLVYARDAQRIIQIRTCCGRFMARQRWLCWLRLTKGSDGSSWETNTHHSGDLFIIIESGRARAHTRARLRLSVSPAGGRNALHACARALFGQNCIRLNATRARARTRFRLETCVCAEEMQFCRNQKFVLPTKHARFNTGTVM